MKQRAHIVIPVLVLALALGGYWWYRSGSGARAAVANVIEGSGTIEAEDVLITAEVSGRVKQLLIDEGQEVRQGTVLVQLDTALLEAQLEQSRAGLDAAKANLDLLKAGSRPEEVAQAQAQLELALSQREGAYSAWQNAKASTVITQSQVFVSGAERVYVATMRNVKNPQELQAQVVQAQTARDNAQAALTQVQINLQATRDRLSLAKTQAESQVKQLAEALTQAQARYAQARANWEYVQETGKDAIQPKVVNQKTGEQQDNNVSDSQRHNYYNIYVQAEAAMHQAEAAVQQAVVTFDTARQAEVTGVDAATKQVAAAEAALANAQQALDTVKHTRANPQQLRAQADIALAQLNNARAGVSSAELQYRSAVDNTYTQLQSAEAQIAQAQARLELAQSGARVEQIRVAEAQVKQAQAAVHQFEVQIGKATLIAPRDGLVLQRPIHEGEQALVGATLMTLGSLDSVRLTVFVPDAQIGRVRQGQQVQVRVDSFPERTFVGKVTYIAPQAEFTPRNVQTKEERVTTVFAVRVELANSDHALKPGMPADATFVE